MFTKIIKFLNDNNVEWFWDKNHSIIIPIENDCVWVNGFGEDMHYNKAIHIAKHNPNYYCGERTGYSLSRCLANGSQQDVVKALMKRFKV